MSARNLRPGDEVFLVPNRPAAPSAAYAQPKVTVVQMLNMDARAVVRLPDGREIETDSRNLADEPHHERTKNMKIRPKLPEGFEEKPLW